MNRSVPPFPRNGMKNSLNIRKNNAITPKTKKTRLMGNLVNLYEIIAAIPPEVKMINAKIECHGVMFPGKMPTPRTPSPKKPKGILSRRFWDSKWIKRVAQRMMIPASIIVVLKIVAEGCLIMLFGGFVAPRSLISFSRVV